MTNHYIPRSLIAASVIWLFALLSVLAQNVRGHVTDAITGTDLPGVSILIQGRNTGAVTDAHGLYTVTFEPGSSYTLQVSFVGYTTQILPVRVTAGSTATLDVRFGTCTALISTWSRMLRNGSC